MTIVRRILPVLLAAVLLSACGETKDVLPEIEQEVKQDDVDLIGHVDAVLFDGAEHLQVHYVGIAHRAVVDIVAATHQRAAFIGQFRGISHG